MGWVRTFSQKYYRLYPWVCWFLAATFYLFQYGFFIFPSSVVSQLQSSLGADLAQVGLLYSAFSYTYIAMQIPVGLMFDRFDAHKLLSLATLLLGVGCLMMAFTSNVSVAVAGRIIMGLGGSFAFVGTVYIGRAWFSAALFPVVIGLTGSMSGLGAIGFNSLFVRLSAVMNWQKIAVALSIIVIILGVLIHICVRNKPGAKHQIERNSESTIKLLRAVLTNKGVVVIALLTGFGYAHFVTIIDMWSIPYLKHHYNLSEVAAVGENSLAFIGAVIGFGCVGFCVKYIQARKVLIIGVTLQFILLFIEFYLPINLWVESVVLFFIGLFASVYILGFDMARSQVLSSEYGVATGLVNMCFTAFGVVFAPLVGYLLTLTGSFKVAALPILFSSFIAICVCAVLPKSSGSAKQAV